MLATYDDNIALQRFMQLSSRSSAGSMPVSHPLPPTKSKNPEPEEKPMQLKRVRITSAERQRRLTQGLCLFCGNMGHLKALCPICPPCSVVSTCLNNVEKLQHPTTNVRLTASHITVTVAALLNSGSANNFLCRYLKIKTIPTKKFYQIQSMTEKPLSWRSVQQLAGPINFKIVLFHQEEIMLLVLKESTSDNNSILPWTTREVLKWGKNCSPPASLQYY